MDSLGNRVLGGLLRNTFVTGTATLLIETHRKVLSDRPAFVTCVLMIGTAIFYIGINDWIAPNRHSHLLTKHTWDSNAYELSAVHYLWSNCLPFETFTHIGLWALSGLSYLSNKNLLAFSMSQMGLIYTGIHSTMSLILLIFILFERSFDPHINRSVLISAVFFHLWFVCPSIIGSISIIRFQFSKENGHPAIYQNSIDIILRTLLMSDDNNINNDNNNNNNEGFFNRYLRLFTSVIYAPSHLRNTYENNGKFDFISKGKVRKPGMGFIIHTSDKQNSVGQAYRSVEASPPPLTDQVDSDDDDGSFIMSVDNDEEKTEEASISSSFISDNNNNNNIKYDTSNIQRRRNELCAVFYTCVLFEIIWFIIYMLCCVVMYGRRVMNTPDHFNDSENTIVRVLTMSLPEWFVGFTESFTMSFHRAFLNSVNLNVIFDAHFSNTLWIAVAVNTMILVLDSSYLLHNFYVYFFSYYYTTTTNQNDDDDDDHPNNVDHWNWNVISDVLIFLELMNVIFAIMILFRLLSICDKYKQIKKGETLRRRPSVFSYLSELYRLVNQDNNHHSNNNNNNDNKNGPNDHTPNDDSNNDNVNEKNFIVAAQSQINWTRMTSFGVFAVTLHLMLETLVILAVIQVGSSKLMTLMQFSTALLWCLHVCALFVSGYIVMIQFESTFRRVSGFLHKLWLVFALVTGIQILRIAGADHSTSFAWLRNYFTLLGVIDNNNENDDGNGNGNIGGISEDENSPFARFHKNDPDYASHHISESQQMMNELGIDSSDQSNINDAHGFDHDGPHAQIVQTWTPLLLCVIRMFLALLISISVLKWRKMKSEFHLIWQRWSENSLLCDEQERKGLLLSNVDRMKYERLKSLSKGVLTSYVLCVIAISVLALFERHESSEMGDNTSSSMVTSINIITLNAIRNGAGHLNWHVLGGDVPCFGFLFHSALLTTIFCFDGSLSVRWPPARSLAVTFLYTNSLFAMFYLSSAILFVDFSETLSLFRVAVISAVCAFGMVSFWLARLIESIAKIDENKYPNTESLFN